MTPGLRVSFPVKTIGTCCVWYAVSSVTSQLTRLVLSRFRFPLLVGLAQFVISALLALIFTLVIRRWPRVGQSFTRGTVPEGDSQDPLFDFRIFAKVSPLGLFQFTGKFFSLTATSLVPLATVSSVKALSPLLIVAGYRIFYGVRYLWTTYLSLIPLMAGVLMIVLPAAVEKQTSELIGTNSSAFDSNHVFGLICAVVSTIIFAAQNIYGRELMTWDVLDVVKSKPKTTPYISPVIRSDAFPVQKYLSHVRRRSSLTLPYSVSDLLLDNFAQKPRHHYNFGKNSNNKASADFKKRSRYGRNYFSTSITNWIENLDLDSLAKPDKISIILYCSLLGALFSSGGVVWRELPLLLNPTKRAELSTVSGINGLISIIVLLLIDAVSHFAQTLLAFHLLGLIPALSYSIASMMKRIVLILMSILVTLGVSPSSEDTTKWWGKISLAQIFGIALITIGLYCYDRGGR